MGFSAKFEILWDLWNLWDVWRREYRNPFNIFGKKNFWFLIKNFCSCKDPEKLRRSWLIYAGPDDRKNSLKSFKLIVRPNYWRDYGSSDYGSWILPPGRKKNSLPGLRRIEWNSIGRNFGAEFRSEFRFFSGSMNPKRSPIPLWIQWNLDSGPLSPIQKSNRAVEPQIRRPSCHSREPNRRSGTVFSPIFVKNFFHFFRWTRVGPSSGSGSFFGIRVLCQGSGFFFRAFRVKNRFFRF